MAGQTNYSTMVKILLSSVLLAAATMIASAAAATEEPTKGTNNKQGRQLNWNGGPSSAYHAADPYLASASSVMSAQQSKPSNYDAAPDQDISRDSAYSAGPPSASYYPTGSDYGYEAAPSDTASYTGNGATSYGDEKQNSFVSALTAFLPIGLFLAAIVPNIVTVSAGRRKRSETEEAEIAKEEASFPILDMISTYGARSLQDPKCQTKIVCEMGRMGGTPEANMLQRALWITANYVPESLARMTGTDALLRSIRSQKCSEFKCSSD